VVCEIFDGNLDNILKSSPADANSGNPMELKFRKREELPKVIELLHSVSIFRDIPARDLESLLEVANEATFQPDQVIVKEGSLLADLYILLAGEVEVRKKETVLATLKAG